MPGRLTTLVKGTFCGKTDTELRRWVNDIPKLKEWLTNLKDLTMTLEDIGIKWEILDDTNQGQLAHCAEFWGNGQGCFFPDLAESLKRGVVRGAFIQGLHASIYKKDANGNDVQRSEALPVVVYWIAGGPAFEAYVSETLREIHVMLLTPDPTPELKVPSSGQQEPIWLVASPEYVRAIKARAPNYPYEPAETLPNGIGVECQQIMSY
jgi:hypothetical protein